MTDESLYYVYQADGYTSHYGRLVCAGSEIEAKQLHREMWREMFDKPSDRDPNDDTYAKEIPGVDPTGMDRGEMVEL